MSVFADSSALVKLYADEPGHEAIRALDVVVVSALAQVEVASAFWRKQRTGELDAVDASVLNAAFEMDLRGDGAVGPRFHAVAVGASILAHAARIVAAQALRAYDAVQLASALAVREVDPGCDTFACFDGQLRDAAAAHGFALVPEAP